MKFLFRQCQMQRPAPKQLDCAERPQTRKKKIISRKNTCSGGAPGRGQFEGAFDAFQKIVTAYTWRIARKSGPTVFPMSC